MKDCMEKRRMIMSRTPLRITFVGGGTDLPEFYREYGPGAVVSAAINKYVYVTVHKRFDDMIRVGYSVTENVHSPDELKHPTVREALKLLKLDCGIEITSMADIPAGGTGMGSSSSFLVGLLNALHAWKGEYATQKQLAEEAVEIERNILKEPGGKQDQYIAAFGGIQYMEFNKDETVVNTPVIMNEKSREELRKNLLLMYTGSQRSSTEIHIKQTNEVEMHLDEYGKMYVLARELFEKLTNNQWKDTGNLMHQNWLLKKNLSNNISNTEIDSWYRKAMDSGALGGKLIGAGGSGFLMFFAPREKHMDIEKSLSKLRIEPFDFEALGSRIIYVGD